MINIYQSNKIEYLINFIVKNINKRKKNPFDKDIIIIQNKDITEWLQIKIAEKIGISANISFQYPMEFFSSLFQKNTKNKIKNIKKTQISWFILKIILNSQNKSELGLFKKYIEKKNKIEKINKISEHISKLFQKYLIHKPEWINIWKKNKIINSLDNNQKWQKYIFISLINEIKKNNINDFFTPYILKKLEKKYYFKNIFSNKKLPKKIIIYRIENFPVLYFKIIKKIEKYIDIYITHFNPFKNSKLLFFDKNIKKKKNLNKENIKTKPLIYSFEKIIKKNISILSEFKKYKIKNAFLNYKRDCLLHHIQQDILNIENYEKQLYKKKFFLKNIKKRKIKKSDLSLTFHSCNNKQKEIEILYYYIINLLRKKNIKPKDIIVMVPNIDQYTPYINSIFGIITEKYSLPFKILDQNLIKNNTILKIFIMLIKLKKKDFTNEKIFKLLEIPELSSKFNIEKNQINLLKKYIHESGTCFNIHNESKNKKRQNTWSFGFKRMILGYIMKNKYNTWNGILPYNSNQELSIELIEKFFKFIESIKKWNKILNKEKKIYEWIPICKKLLKKFFTFNKKNQSILNFIIKEWNNILEEGKKTKINCKIPISIIYNKFQKNIKNIKKNKHFFSNNINFCNFNKTRNIPFKVICLLGMNHLSYSLINKNTEFDLIKKKINNEKYQNQYFFLENLILASHFLFISYIKNNIYNHDKEYPSQTVSELINYISNSFYITRKNFSNSSKNSINIKEYIIKKYKNIFFEKNILYHKNKKKEIKKIEKKNEKKIHIKTIKKEKNKNTVTLDELLYFYKHPIKNFFNKQLNINFSTKEIQLKNKEKFEINKLDEYKFNNIILKLMINKIKKKEIIKIIISTGLFPIKNFGIIYIEKQIEKLKSLLIKLKKYNKKKFNKSFCIKFNKIELTGKLIKIQENKIIRYSPTNLTINHGLSLWIEHLIFCSYFKSCSSHYFGINNSEWYFKKINKKEAKLNLKKLITGYQQGSNFPFILFQKSGWKWLNYFYDKKTKKINLKLIGKEKKANEKLIQSLNGYLNRKGEIHDIYNIKIFKEPNEKLIEKIKKNTIKYLLPITKFAKYKKIKN